MPSLRRDLYVPLSFYVTRQLHLRSRGRTLFSQARRQAGRQEAESLFNYYSLLCRLHAKLPAITQDTLAVLRGGDLKRVRVVAVKHVDAGALRLPPLVTSRHSFVTLCTSPYSIQVMVPLEGGDSVCLHIVAAPNLPKPLLFAGTPSVEGHQWKPCDMAWPFWAVRRSDVAAQCNCVFSAVPVNCVSTFGLGRAGDSNVVPSGPVASPSELVIDTMTNERDLEKDEELVVYWPARVSSKSAPTARPRTWRDQVRASKSTATQAA